MATTHPFKTLLDLAQRSRDCAQGLPAQEELKTHWSGIGFSIANERLVAPMDEVAEILPVPPVSRLPGVQPWVRGVANVRGRLLPLIDLEQFFGGSLTAARRRHRVLVLEQGELFAGLIVSEVFGMQHFPSDAFEPLVPESAERLRDFTTGIFTFNDRIWTVFKLKELVSDARFANAAA